MNRTLEILIISSPIFHVTREHEALIRGSESEINLTVTDAGSLTDEMIDKAEIVFGWLSEKQLEKAVSLKWLQLPSAGADGFTNRESFHNSDIRVTNASGVYGLPIAEHVFGMILSHNRNLQDFAYHKSEKKWHRNWETKDFYGSTIGILGLGDIGNEIAKRAKAWGARVLAVKRTLTQVPEYVDRLYPMEEMDEVLKQSDYVVLALPNTPKTNGLITEEKLRLMKPAAFLVNIGRGVLIDQEALIKALSEGWIAGAGLDVTEPEPLPEDSPLWELPNVILTPHTSGSSPSNDERRFQIFYHNLAAYLGEQPLNNLVDFKEGY